MSLPAQARHPDSARQSRSTPVDGHENDHRQQGRIGTPGVKIGTWGKNVSQAWRAEMCGIKPYHIEKNDTGPYKKN